MDSLKVERERGITVKAQSASMFYSYPDDGRYLLNLIDTPGHSDFSFEVKRSLQACQGALLLVDASQGIQAQTYSTYYAAIEKGLKIIPVVTKIDLPHADAEEAILSVAATFDLDPEDVIPTSAKTGEGVDLIFPRIVRDIPPPTGSIDAPSRSRIIDSWYDELRGVVCLVQVVDGKLEEGDRIWCMGAAASTKTREEFGVQEIGVITPIKVRTRVLYAGQVGYVVSGMRSISQAVVGDTITLASYAKKSETTLDIVVALPGTDLSQLVKPNVYASVFPTGDDGFEELYNAVQKLRLNDLSITVQKEEGSHLGTGLRCGFLGLLHLEVFQQRLQDEFDIAVVFTSPIVPYRLSEKKTKKKWVIESIRDWPMDSHKGLQKHFIVEEPIVHVSVLSPAEYLGSILTLCRKRRGVEIELRYLTSEKVFLKYELPWQEIVSDFQDQIKSLSSGYASFDYEDAGYREAKMVKVDMALNGEVVDGLSFICHEDMAYERGRMVAERLRETISRQQYEIVIQARLGTKPIARERIAPYRKDVLTKSGKTVGGGDITRKRKLLEKQKAGKKRVKEMMAGRARVSIPQEAFWTVLKNA